MKCKSGFCAQDQDECVTLYGEAEVEQAGQPSAICQSEQGSLESKYFRCEDGICRPGKYNTET